MKPFEPIDKAAAAPLFTLATQAPHHWSAPQSVPPDPDRGRHQQTERACTRCPLVKITVHPEGGGGYRFYRFADGAQFYDRIEPECVAADR